MASTTALFTGLSGLNVNSKALDVIGNNIANVNTEGYSRQRVTLKTAPPLRTPQGFLGSGVSVETVERIRSTLVDQQLMSEKPSLNQYEFKNDALQFVEGIHNEGLSASVNADAAGFIFKRAHINEFRQIIHQQVALVAQVRAMMRDEIAPLDEEYHGEIRSLAGTRTSVKRTCMWPCGASSWPNTFIGLRIATPGVPAGTTNWLCRE